MTKVRLPPIGFWSYARRDDELSEDNLTRLRELVKREIQLQYGRDDIKLFQDTATIPHGAAWERETLQALSESTFFIPIITPNFIQSEWCCREVAIFLEREQELLALYPDLPARSRIFPIDYRRIQDGNGQNPAILTALRGRQWCEFQNLREEDPRSKVVKAKVNELAESICDLLFVEVERPLSAAERARQDVDARERREQAEAARRHASELKAREKEETARGPRERPAAAPAEAQEAAKSGPSASKSFLPAIDWTLFGLLAAGALLFAALIEFYGQYVIDDRQILKVMLGTMAFGLPAAAYGLIRGRRASLALYLLGAVPIFHLLALTVVWQLALEYSAAEDLLAGFGGGTIGAGLSFLALPMFRLNEPDRATLVWTVAGTIALAIFASVTTGWVINEARHSLLLIVYLPWQLGFAFLLARLIRPRDQGTAGAPR